MPRSQQPKKVLTWQKSSFSGASEECVELAASDRVWVRDSKAHGVGHLQFHYHAWERFICSVIEPS
ncbi:DUF397 domain-containing protein [Streptomyces puniciscabiei]